jgi:hypothetical protein
VPLLTSLAVLLLLAVLATRGGSAVPHGRGLVLFGGGQQAPVQPAGPPPTALPGRLNPVVGVGISTIIAVALVAYLCAMIMMVVLLLSLRWVRRRRGVGRTAQLTEPDTSTDADLTLMLLQGTRSALAQLRQRAGGPPSDAVQRAWLALERAAAECGTPRRPEQTPTEFTAAVLAANAVDAAAVDTLRGLYQRARFGRTDAVTAADADAAVAALDRIAATLAGTGVGRR